MLKYMFSVFIVLAFALFLLTGCSEDNPVEPEEVHFEAIGLYVISSGDTIVEYVGGEVTGKIEVLVGTQTALLSIRFLDEDGDIGVPVGSEYDLSWNIADESVATVVSHEEELKDYQFHIEGKQIGSTSITVILNHNDHKDFESKAIDIQVNQAI
jgi:hypothetical protein